MKQDRRRIRRNHRLMVTLAGVTAAAALLAACGSSGSGSSGSGSSGSGGGGDVTLSVVTSLTGKYALIGEEEKQALDAIAAATNKAGGIKGRHVKFSYLDNESQASVAVSLAGPLIRKVQVLFVGGAVGQMLPVNELAKSGGPVQLDMSPGVHPDPSSNVFAAAAAPTNLAVKVDLTYLASKGLHKIALVSSNDPSGQDGAAQVKEALKSSPLKDEIQLVTTQTFDDTAVSATAQASNVARSGAQAVVLWSSGPTAGIFFNAMKQAGIHLPVATTSANEDVTLLGTQFKTIVPKSIVFASPMFYCGTQGLPAAQAQAVSAMTDIYKNQLKTEPNVGTSLSWDFGNIIMNALKELGPDATADQIRGYIEGLSSYSGVDAPYSYSSQDHVGVSSDSFRVCQWTPSSKTFTPVSDFGGKAT